MAADTMAADTTATDTTVVDTTAADTTAADGGRHNGGIQNGGRNGGRKILQCHCKNNLREVPPPLLPHILALRLPLYYNSASHPMYVTCNDPGLYSTQPMSCLKCTPA